MSCEECLCFCFFCFLVDWDDSDDESGCGCGDPVGLADVEGAETDPDCSPESILRDAVFFANKVTRNSLKMS